MSKTIFSIIIPTSGKNPLLKDCLSSLKKQNFPADQIQILTITNQDIKKIGKDFSFSAAVNLASRKATGKYLLITNDDIIFKNDALQGLLKALHSHPNSLIGAAIWDKPRQKPLPAGYTINLWTGLAKPVYTQNNPESCDWISGCSLCLDLKLWKKLSGFDESFRPGFFEDADLCFRAKRLGLKLILSPEFQVLHAQTSTFNLDLPKKYAAWYRNKILFLRKHASPFQLATSLALQYIFFTPVRALIVRDGRLLPALKGLFWNLKDSLNLMHKPLP